MSLMGVDVGSSGCKATVFALDGREVAQATVPYTAQFLPPDRVELDPMLLWQSVTRAVREAAAAASHDLVTALCFTTHGETLILLGADDVPLCPAIMNADARARELINEWEQRLGRERIYDITGLVLSPMYPLIKFDWLRRRQPDLFQATRRFATISDFLLTRLGLPPYLDYSLAARYLTLERRARRWSEELLTQVGVTPEHLPRPVPAGTVAGALSPAAARELGLTPGVQVVVGGHDQACSALGAGAITPGTVSASLGTYECLVALGTEPPPPASSLAAGIDAYNYVLPDLFMSIAYFPSGLVVKWCLDQFCQTDVAQAASRGQDIYEYLESHVPSEPTELYLLPHLIGSCTPEYNASARGAIYGLTPSTTRLQLYKAVLEGIACELAIVVACLQQVAPPFDTLLVTGGGTRSTLGLQLRAAIARLRIQMLEVPEATCLGAALLAGVATGIYPNITDAVAQTVRPGKTISPDPELIAAYREHLQQYCRFYPALAPLRDTNLT